MSKIYMKCKNYDANTNSILVAFASDKTKSQDPEVYGYLNYQPYSMFPDVIEESELKEKLIQLGIAITNEIVRQDQISNDENYQSMMNNINNKSFVYDIPDVPGDSVPIQLSEDIIPDEITE